MFSIISNTQQLQHFVFNKIKIAIIISETFRLYLGKDWQLAEDETYVLFVPVFVVLN
jgi:hypothetical protein